MSWLSLIYSAFRRSHRSDEMINRGPHFLQSVQSATQVRNDFNYTTSLPISAGHNSLYQQANVCDAVCVTYQSGVVKVDVWSATFGNSDLAVRGLHYAYHPSPPSLIFRIRHACRAFVNAWRGA